VIDWTPVFYVCDFILARGGYNGVDVIREFKGAVRPFPEHDVCEECF